jgi:hypothetical protein
MLTLDRLHSVDADTKNDLIIAALIATDGRPVQFALTKQAAALLLTGVQAAAKSLSQRLTGYSLVPAGVQAVIGPDLEPGLAIDLGGNLTITLQLGPSQLAALKAAIASIEQKRTSGGPRH